jgi:WD40 repeat protein
LSFDAWADGGVITTDHTLKVIAPPPGAKLEAVSARLKKSLQHTNRDSQLVCVQYSPDGKRIIAGDYPGGVVQVWDAASGKQLTQIETGFGFRGSAEYLHLTPDWSSLFVCREKRKPIQFERDGKKMFRWEMDGGVRSWDLATGQLREYYRHDPAHSVRQMWLSPNGRQFATNEELSGESEGAPKHGSTLWDVVTRQQRSLPDRMFMGMDGFSPDGRRLVGSRIDDDAITTALELMDTATATVVESIPIDGKFSRIVPYGFSPDSQSVVLTQQVYPGRKDFSTWRFSLKIWDLKSKRETLAYTPEKPIAALTYPKFSKDGRTLCAVSFGRAEDKVFLFDLAQQRLTRTIALGDHSKICGSAVFSPDGSWLAVISQAIPEKDLLRERSPDRVAQPHIHLIDAARGEIRETLICPPGFPGTPCFSPDGKTLATGGRGKVHLWDVSDLK